MDCCFYCNKSFDYEKSKLNCPHCNKVGHLSCILDLIKYNSFCRNCGKILKVHNRHNDFFRNSSTHKIN